MTNPGNLLLGALVLIPGGLCLLLWSIRVWWSPEYIRSIGFMYKYFLRWLPDDAVPTEKQIKSYAGLGVFIGSFSVSVGLLFTIASLR
jgi:hypothetical protein